MWINSIVVFADVERTTLRDIGQSLPRLVHERRHAIGLAENSRGVAAGLVICGIAVRDGLVELPVIEHALQRPGVGHLEIAVQHEKVERVDIGLRAGEHQRAIDRQLLDRRRTLPVHRVVRAGIAEIQLRGVRMHAKRRIHIPHPVVGEPPPTVPVQRSTRDIDAEDARIESILRGHRAIAVGAARQLDVRALVGETVLHRDGYGATEGVETVDRTRAHELDLVDGDVREKIPIDGIAERLVDAHAVLIDRQTLRGAEYGRGLETAIQDVRLKRIVEVVVDVDAREIGIQGARQACGAVPASIRGDRICTFPGILSISMVVPGIAVAVTTTVSRVGPSATSA